MLGGRATVAVWTGVLTSGLLVALLARSRTATDSTAGWIESSTVFQLVLPSESQPASKRVDPSVIEAAGRHGLDPALVAAIIEAESAHDRAAISPKGAVGLMQVMPETAHWIGGLDPADPAANLEAGCRYFAHLLDSFGGDVVLALAAYNAGPAMVRRWGTVPPFRETRTFIARVDATYRSLTGLGLAEASRFAG